MRALAVVVALIFAGCAGSPAAPSSVATGPALQLEEAGGATALGGSSPARPWVVVVESTAGAMSAHGPFASAHQAREWRPTTRPRQTWVLALYSPATD